MRVKVLSLDKVQKNMMNNQYVSTTYKRADGEADVDDGDAEEDEIGSHAATSKRTSQKPASKREIDNLVDVGGS